MSLSAKLRRAPLRIATGAYILNTGVTKLGADDDTAKSLHGVASNTYPFLNKAEPKVFTKALGVGEVAVGAALLLPIVPPFVAGAALVGFSGTLLHMYWNTPGMHQEGTPRPTAQGQPVAKDVWMMGIGLGLMADATFEPAHDRVVEFEASTAQKRADRSRRAQRKAKKARKAVQHGRSEYLQHARETAMELQTEAAKRAQKAAKKARKQAEHASELTAARLADMRDEFGPTAADKAQTARKTARNAVDEYGPIAMDKARAARDAARHAVEQYGPVAVEKAKAAGEAARDLADEYRPVATEKVKLARHAAKEYTAKAQKTAAKAQKNAAKAQKKAAKARDRIAS
jgi:uncharacterized membrane protein YphA (DoxX/SURF4 family)